MRPKSIILFERFFLGSLVIGVLNAILNWENDLQAIAANPSLANYGPGFIIFVSLFVWAFGLLFWYLIARKASNTAKWIFVILFFIGLVTTPLTTLQNPTLIVAITLIMGAMQIYALYMLFRPDAKEWFDTKGGMHSLDNTLE
jgi:hypothetical protein|tara:strand:- start:57 stop:485 length:429 start_codon:yes stop_codon:yes gene_type:complete